MLFLLKKFKTIGKIRKQNLVIIVKPLSMNPHMNFLTGGMRMIL